jgi:nitroreductase
MASSAGPRVPIRDLVALACRAPSVHNTQPWLWVVDADSVSLFADQRRQLEHADPDGRDLVISCGAALHHLKVVAAAAGWHANIRRLPNPSSDAQLATVTFDASAVDESAVRAVEVLRRRRTDRRRTGRTPVAREDLDALLAVAGPFGVVAFAVVSAQVRTSVFRLLAEADATQRRDPAYLNEISAWVDRGRGEGVPSTNLLQHPPAVGDRGAPTRFPPGLLEDGRADGEEERTSALVVLCTSSDDVASRVRAGEALSALLLTGDHLGLSLVPLSQATEVDRVRLVLQDELLEDAAHPQILVSVGRPVDTRKPVPLTPRRPVAEVLCDHAGLPESLGPYHPPPVAGRENQHYKAR